MAEQAKTKELNDELTSVNTELSKLLTEGMSNYFYYNNHLNYYLLSNSWYLEEWTEWMEEPRGPVPFSTK